jgi:serine/threonine-protein kinase
MGEVYRAEDLTLDQPVALKFLSGIVAAGDARLAQFHNELKTARQVSHKNVCRLYDLGEADGRRFLTMEYVDGEDLSSLLRRIGRIPHDKAVDIARQLCAGVAAAHDRGVVHRDLKPSNVMIDAEGNVRITDFGIATAAGEANERTAGTPQYMAPELFTGAPASVKSDIYALGLILFEVFTGRRAVDAKTLAELQDFHRRGTVTTPSAIVRDVDPAVERLILRCLDRSPERRPATALVVAAGLPGADPLAEALAAGETPSPDLLAAAPKPRPSVRVAASPSSWPRSSPCSSASADRPVGCRRPRTLRSLAPGTRRPCRAHHPAFGYPATTGDSAFGFARHAEFTRWLMAKRETPDRYEPMRIGRPPAIHFWYRSSPRPLLPLNPPQLTIGDPPSLSTAMRTVVLDPQGRLQQFRSVPIQVEKDEPAAQPVDWTIAFGAAGLDMATFAPATPQWVPGLRGLRAAWEGPCRALTAPCASKRARSMAGLRTSRSSARGRHRRPKSPADRDAAIASSSSSSPSCWPG